MEEYFWGGPDRGQEGSSGQTPPECSMSVSGAALKWRLCPELGDQDGEEEGRKIMRVHTHTHLHIQPSLTHTGTHAHPQEGEACGSHKAQIWSLADSWETRGPKATRSFRGCHFRHSEKAAPSFHVLRGPRDPMDHSEPHPLLTRDP